MMVVMGFVILIWLLLFNLGKLVWSLVIRKDNLWVNALTHKYLSNNNSILNANCPPGASYTWCGIIKAKKGIFNGLGLDLGMVRVPCGLVIGTCMMPLEMWCLFSQSMILIFA